jgi:flagellar basal body P-ring protein FlgI
MKNFKLLTLCAALLLAPAVQAERLKDLASVAGVRQNQLMGYGLVVGLDGSGDQTTQTPFTVQSVASMLQSMGVALPPGTTLQLKNVAAVMVTTNLPAFAQPGQQIDVTVSSMGNAKSLRGGTLHGTRQCSGGRRWCAGAGRRRCCRRQPPVGWPHFRRRHGGTRGADHAGRRQPDSP